jgi:hypothetical protein
MKRSKEENRAPDAIGGTHQERGGVSLPDIFFAIFWKIFQIFFPFFLKMLKWIK